MKVLKPERACTPQPRASSVAHVPRGGQPQLTQRQHQILDLLRAGKVNKEIANELGIGVGTVKQHVVALFKRLNVKNRAMAVSRGMGLRPSRDEAGVALAADGLLERRPCVVLSIALPEEASHESVRRLHGTLAALAFDSDALFLARKGHAGDIIFGIQRVTEYDLIKALHTAYAIFKDLSELAPELAGAMRGGLTAGLAIASMKRFGGWSGEAIASEAIASARELLRNAVPGQLIFGQPAQDLMQAFGAGGRGAPPSAMPFSGLEALRWTGERDSFALVGRGAELESLVAALQDAGRGRGKLVNLSGETGMGKSRLCRQVVESCKERGGSAWFFRCLPLGAGEQVFDISDTAQGEEKSAEELMALLRLPPPGRPGLVVVDDLHLLAQGIQSLIYAASADAAAKGWLVILSSRTHSGSAADQGERIHLRRLPTDAIERLVGEVIGRRRAKARSGGVQAIARMAAGVPLFAVELSKRYGGEMLALPLLVVVCARLDGLRLDRKMLRSLARSSGSLALAEVADALGEDVETTRQAAERALAAGGVTLGPDGRFSFSHPLLRQVIEYLSME